MFAAIMAVAITIQDNAIALQDGEAAMAVEILGRIMIVDIA